MRSLSLFFCLALAALAQAAEVPFPIADVPIHASGEAAQFVNGRVTPPKQTSALIDLKKYRGKPVILAMISLTCGHCVTAVQYLIQLQDQYGPQGLQVVGVAGSEHADVELPQWLQRFRPNFPFGYLPQEPFLKLAGLAPDARPFVPLLLFIDPTGTVRARKFGNDPDMKSVENGLLQGTRVLMSVSAPLMKK
jgi:thiol-disulfide isomerase/thioredoxin